MRNDQMMRRSQMWLHHGPGMKIERAKKEVDMIFNSGCWLSERDYAFLNHIALEYQVSTLGLGDERKLDGLARRAAWNIAP